MTLRQPSSCSHGYTHVFTCAHVYTYIYEHFQMTLNGRTINVVMRRCRHSSTSIHVNTSAATPIDKVPKGVCAFTRLPLSWCKLHAGQVPLCKYMYRCPYRCLHTCPYTCVLTCLYTYPYTCLHTCLDPLLYTCPYTCRYKSAQIYLHTSIHMSAHISICISTHISVCILPPAVCYGFARSPSAIVFYLPEHADSRGQGSLPI